jgi:hypothetical protein
VSFRFTPKRVHLVRGSFLLFEYLMPPKITATAQGEHVSSLTLMSKGEMLACFTGSVCLSLMASTTAKMA